jgi:hypothetical protein
MSTTSFRRLVLSGHQLPSLCGPDKLTMALAEAKPIRQHAPGTLVNKGKMKGWSATPRPTSCYLYLSTFSWCANGLQEGSRSQAKRKAEQMGEAHHARILSGQS